MRQHSTSESNLQAWIRQGYLSPNATRADLIRGRLAEHLAPSPRTPQPPREKKKLGPDDYLHFFGKLLEEEFPPSEENYPFTDEKDWRFDRAWPDWKIAVELHGGVNDSPRRGHHVRAAGFTNDRDKINRAQLLGWIVIEVVCPGRIAQGLELLQEAFALRGAG